MACSVPELDEIKKIGETLYAESYFRLLRNKNNVNDAADEFRSLISQMDAHCKIQNMNKKSADEFKFQITSEYSSVIDNQDLPGLLPVISENIKIENCIPSLQNKDYSSELLKVRQRCMELVEKKIKLNSTVPLRKDDEERCSFPTEYKALNERKSMFTTQSGLNSHSVCNSLNTKQTKEIVNKFSKSSHQSEVSLSKNFNYASTSTTSFDKKQFHNKPSPQRCVENSLKRRTVEANDCMSRFPKKQNYSSSSKKYVDIRSQKEGEKNSFMTASSMYKNPMKKSQNSNEHDSESANFNSSAGSDVKTHPSLKNFDPKIVGIILSEIMDFSPDVKWNDIAGLEFVKSTVQEIVIWPLLRPDIFTGLRAPPRGILLFGPPGTGKTLIGKCIATESNSTFFCISASSLASKWVGESEQLVRALFAVAQLHQPAVIFIDEIDSLLSQRSDQEQDHTRKLKTEFLVQFDGAKTNSERRVLVVGATNRPHELDEAARRRFVKRLFVPLPEEAARLQIIEKLLASHQHSLSNCDLKKICEETKGYSGSDVAHLCKEAAMGPIRSIGPEQIKTVSLDQVRSIELIDFIDALKQVRASVAQEDLNYYLEWNKKFGSFAV